jgi:hypothetical protein
MGELPGALLDEQWQDIPQAPKTGDSLIVRAKAFVLKRHIQPEERTPAALFSFS